MDLSNPRDIFLDKLPERPSYNFRRVRDWNANLIADYLAKIRAGALHIQANKIKVPSPVAEFIGDNYREQKGTVFFTGKLTLRLSHPDPEVHILVSDSSFDPRHAKQRDEFQGTKDFDVAALASHPHHVTIGYMRKWRNWGILHRPAFVDETIERTKSPSPGPINEMKYTVNSCSTTEDGVRSSARSSIAC